MKKLVFLSDMAFDANCSLSKRLKKYYDFYFFTIGRGGVYDRLGKFDIDNEIVSAENINNFNILSEYFDLSKTFLIKHHSFKKLWLFSIVLKIIQDIKVLFFIRKISPDVVMTDTPNFPLTRFFYRKRMVSIVHDPFPHSGEHTFYRKIQERTMTLMASRFLLFNENQRSRFIEHYHIPSSNVFSSFLSQYELMNLYGTSNPAPSVNNILFFGRISPYKGINFLVDGFRKYVEVSGRKDVTLTIAGAGIYDFDIDKIVEDFPQIILFKRFLSMDELANAIRNCCFTICPYTDATQSGVIMTSFALKKPVVATKVGGLPEMLNYGDLGLLIEPKSSEAIFHSFEYIFSSPDILNDYSQKISDLYFDGGIKSWESSIQIIIKCINSLL